MAQDYNNIGNVFYSLGNYHNYQEALEYYHKVRAIDEDLGDRVGMTHDYYNIGNVFYYLGNYQEALEYYHKVRAIREELGDKVGLTKNYTNIGIVLSNLGNYQEALEYHNKAIESRTNTLTIDANYAIALYNRSLDEGKNREN